MYKDKEKQRQARNEANRRYRRKRNAPESTTIDEVRDTHTVIPSKVIPDSDTLRDTHNVTPKCNALDVMPCDTPTQADWDSLPPGVARPRPDSPDWVHGLDYAHLIYKLIHWSIDQLIQAGLWIPSWKCKREEVQA